VMTTVVSASSTSTGMNIPTGTRRTNMLESEITKTTGIPCRNQGDKDYCECYNCGNEAWDYIESIYMEIYIGGK